MPKFFCFVFLRFLLDDHSGFSDLEVGCWETRTC